MKIGGQKAGSQDRWPAAFQQSDLPPCLALLPVPFPKCLASLIYGQVRWLVPPFPLPCAMLLCRCPTQRDLQALFFDNVLFVWIMKIWLCLLHVVYYVFGKFWHVVNRWVHFLPASFEVKVYFVLEPGMRVCITSHDTSVRFWERYCILNSII